MASNTIGQTLFGAGASGHGGVGATGASGANSYGPVGHGSSEQVTGGRRSRFGIGATSVFGLTPPGSRSGTPRRGAPRGRPDHLPDDERETNDQNPENAQDLVKTEHASDQPAMTMMVTMMNNHCRLDGARACSWLSESS